LQFNLFIDRILSFSEVNLSKDHRKW